LLIEKIIINLAFYNTNINIFLMKKITFLIVLVAFIFGTKQIQSQVINETATWPDSNWEVTGSFSLSGFNHNPSDNPYTTPTPGDSFGYDNQEAGSGALFDLVAVESPVFDLRAATISTPPEEQIVIIFDYVYYQVGSLLTLQYTTDSSGVWTDWQEINGNSSSGTDYKNCAGYMSFESTPLLLTQFDEGQLQNFRFRIQFDDNSALVQFGGFCMGAPTLQSRETPLCFGVTNISAEAATITGDSAIIDWQDQNGTPPNDGWEIEYGETGFVQGSGTTVSALSNPYSLTGLEDTTCYDVYVRAICDAATDVTSDWVGPYNFCTINGPTGCGDNFYDIGGAESNYNNSMNEITTICPDNAGDVVTVVFDTFNTESGFDDLTIYDGDSTSSPVIGTFTGTNSPGVISATIANGGCLTFEFNSDSSVTRPGWEARILCSPPITCFMPENLVVDVASVTLHEASISWSDTNTTAPTNGWTVEYGEEGFELGTGIAVDTTTESLDLTDLDSGTRYCFYVKAKCDDTDESFWQGTTCFTTKIGCGDNFYDNGGPLNNYANSTDETTTICPEEAGEVVTVVFDAFNTEAGWDDLKVYDGPTTSSPLLATLEGDIEPGMISATIANGGCLTFVFHSDGSVNRPGWESRIFCSPPITCFFPEDLEAEARIHEVDLSWTDTNTISPLTSNWDIQYGPDGFDLGDGTIVNTSDNPFTLTGLDAETAYCAYVKANCDNNEDSFWQGPVCFTTLCEVIAAPYFEDFENGGETPQCWTQSDNDNGDWFFSNDVTVPGNVGNAGDVTTTSTDPTGYFAYVDDGFADGNIYTMSSPMVDVSTLVDPTLYFYYLSHNQGGQNINFSVDIWDGATWNTNFFTSNTNTNSWNQIILDLTTLTITGPIQVRFNVTDNNGGAVDDFAIDNVEIKEAPSCWPVFDMNISNITTTSADISWIDNNDVAPDGGWDIEITYPTFPQGSGDITTVYSNNTSLTGLIPSSTYVLFIRTNCASDGSNSTIWTGPYEFTTPTATPFNDECADAIELVVGTSQCENQTLGNNIMATQTSPSLATECSDPVINGVTSGYVVDDVWYKFIMPSTGTAVIEITYAGVMEDSVAAVYRVTDTANPCDNFEFAESYMPDLVTVLNGTNYSSCSDDDDFDTGNDFDDNNNFTRIIVQNVTPGELYYIRVWSYDASHLINEDGSNRENVHGQFLICVKGEMDTRVSTLDTEEEVLSNEVTLDYYPNPVDHTLNLKSSNEIKIVTMYNILGQEVLRRNYDVPLTETELNTTALKTGTYFVKVLLSNNVVKTFKIIRN
jgi:hypothetical protein